MVLFFILEIMFRKFVVCLSLLNIVAYASENEFDNKNESFGSVSDQKGQTDVVKHPESQTEEAQSAEPVELDPASLQSLAYDLYVYAADKNKFDDMEKVFFRIPEKQRSQAINGLAMGRHTPLMIAAANGNLKGVQFLVEHGADIYIKDGGNLDAFKCAEIWKQPEVMDYLRSKVDLITNLAPNFCSLAADQENFDKMISMLDGISEKQRSQLINSQDDQGDTPLIIASRNGNLKCVEFLVENGADIYAKDAGGRNAYYWAEQEGQTNVVDYLDAIAKILTNIAQSFCSLASSKDSLDEMKSMLDSIPEKQRSQVINCPVAGSTNALKKAAINGNLDGVKFLLEHGADIYSIIEDFSIVEVFGSDTLSLAERRGYTDVVKYLYSQIANTELGQVRLKHLAYDLCFCAVHKNKLADMKKIFFRIPEKQRRQIINCPSFLGMNPLMTASFHGNFEGVKFLVEHGVDIYAKDAGGKTAYYWAERGGNKDVAEYLRSKDTLGLYQNPLDIVRRFIENKSTPDNSDNIELDQFHLRVLADALGEAVEDKDRFEAMKMALSLISRIPEEQRSEVINCPVFLA